MKKTFKFGAVNFSEKNCVIIAEAGVNHNGSIKIAEKLIKEAKKNGADIIKFQTYKAEELTIKKSPKFWDWKEEKSKTQFDAYKKLDSFNKEEYRKLISLCKKNKIEFMSTPFDNKSVDMLYNLGVKGFKIASCDITNYPLLKKIAKKKLPIFISTGASTIQEILDTVNFLKRNSAKKICIMQCTLCYPTKPENANLNSISELKTKFPNHLIGFSDHTLGITISSASVVSGARVIEKHFTIDKKLKKSADHWLSINPKELKELRENINEIMLSLKIKNKKVLACEKQTRKFARRSLVIFEDIKKGTIINEKNIIPKRPGTGISPKYFNQVIGRKTKTFLEKDRILKFSDLE